MIIFQVDDLDDGHPHWENGPMGVWCYSTIASMGTSFAPLIIALYSVPGTVIEMIPLLSMFVAPAYTDPSSDTTSS